MVNLPARARLVRWVISSAMSWIDLRSTHLRTGTNRPWGVAIAREMLCCERRVRVGFDVGFCADADGPTEDDADDDGEAGRTSRRALRIGNSVRAMEMALMMKGRAEIFGRSGEEVCVLRSLRRVVRAVRSYSSVKRKWGIARERVIVWYICVWMGVRGMVVSCCG